MRQLGQHCLTVSGKLGQHCLNVTGKEWIVWSERNILLFVQATIRLLYFEIYNSNRLRARHITLLKLGTHYDSR